MSKTLHFGNRTITAEEIIPLLAGYQLLPQLLRELIIDEAIAPIKCTPEEEDTARQQFYTQNQLTNETQRQGFISPHSNHQP